MLLSLLYICIHTEHPVVFYLYAAAKDAVCATGRCTHGIEPNQCSLLYYLSYLKTAGGLNGIIGTDPGVGAQELKVKVCNLFISLSGVERTIQPLNQISFFLSGRSMEDCSSTS
jgi:hypothetical protein